MRYVLSYSPYFPSHRFPDLWLHHNVYACLPGPGHSISVQQFSISVLTPRKNDSLELVDRWRKNVFPICIYFHSFSTAFTFFSFVFNALFGFSFRKGSHAVYTDISMSAPAFPLIDHTSREELNAAHEIHTLTRILMCILKFSWLKRCYI